MFGLMAYWSSKVINQMLEKTTQTKEKEEQKIEEKNEKRRQFLNVHERATSYVNPVTEEDPEDGKAESDEEEN